MKIFLLLVLLVGCSKASESSDNDSPRFIGEADAVAAPDVADDPVPAVPELPTCTVDNAGVMLYLIPAKAFYVCDGMVWTWWSR